jgi:hypothetical protein
MSRVTPKLLGILALLLPASPSRAQAPNHTWVRSYDNQSPTGERPLASVADASGNLFVGGQTQNAAGNIDWLIAKFSAATGDVLWKVQYDGSAAGADVLRVMRVDLNGDLIVAGTQRTNPGAATALRLAKYSGATGAELSVQSLPTTAIPVAAAFDGAGDVVFTGIVQTGSSFTRNIYTGKMSATTGALLWSKSYDNPAAANAIDEGTCIAVDSADNVIVGGKSEHTPGSSDYDIIVAKYSGLDGTPAWTPQRYNGTSTNARDEASLVTVDLTDDIVVAGITNGSSYDFYTGKFSGSTGAPIWTRVLANASLGSDRVNAVTVDAANNVIVAGALARSSGESAGYLAKYAAATGATIWERTREKQSGTQEFNEGFAVRVLPGGDLLYGGTVQGAVATDLYFARLDGSTGTPVWEQTYDSDEDESARQIVTDGLGNALVVGLVANSRASVGDLYLVKYALVDGAIAWEREFGLFTTGKDDVGNAVAVDADDDVIVTGYSVGFGRDIYTAKYANVNGALLWERRVVGSSGRDDEGSAIAVDAAGDVFVAGYTTNLANNTDLYTAKYDGTTGTQKWERIFAGSGNTQEKVEALALDAAGNVFVLGILRPTSAASSSSAEGPIYVAKYNGSTGAIVWSHTTTETVPLTFGVSPYPLHLAVDSAGLATFGASVVGDRISGLLSTDVLIRKLATDGTQAWQKTFRGVDFGNDHLDGLAVNAGDEIVASLQVQAAINTTESRLARYAANGNVLLNATTATAGRLTLDPAGQPLLLTDAAPSVTIPGNNGTVYAVPFYFASDDDLSVQKDPASGGNVNLVKGTDYTVSGAGNPGGGSITTTAAIADTDSLIVTRHVYNRVLKLASGDASVTWDKEFPLGTRFALSTFGRAIRADSAGNAIVLSGPFQRVTSLASADGGIIYNVTGPATLGRGLALGSDGLPIVTGTGLLNNDPTVGLNDSPIDNDFITVKFGPVYGGLAIQTLEPTNVTQTTATLRAQVNPAGLATSVEFFVDGTSVGSVSAGSGTSPVIVEKQITTFPRTAQIGSLGTNTSGSAPGGNVLLVAPNRRPTTQPDTVTLTSLLTQFTPQQNDSDPDGDPITITQVGFPRYGDATILAGGTKVAYAPYQDYPGTDTFSYVVTDSFGGSSVGRVTITGFLSGATIVYSSGGTVPGAAGAGLDAASKWKTFGAPCISKGGSLTFLATVLAPTKPVSLLFGPANQPVAVVGKPVTGIADAVYAKLGDPVCGEGANGVKIAWLATIKGTTRTAGIAASNDSVLMSDIKAAGLGAVAREGSALVFTSGTPAGLVVKSIDQIAMDGDGQLYAVITLKMGVAGVTKDDDTIIVRWSRTTTELALRENAAINFDNADHFVKTIAAFTPAKETLAAARGPVLAGGARPSFRLAFKDGTQAIYRVPDVVGNTAAVVQAFTGDEPPGLTGAKFSTFGFPAGGPIATYLTNLAIGPGSVSKTNDVVLVGPTTAGGPVTDTIAFREGGELPGDSQVKTIAFTEPLGGEDNGLVTFATLTGTGVGSTNKRALLWHKADGAKTVAARLGKTLPNVDNATLLSIGAFAHPSAGSGLAHGPVFLAKLKNVPAARAQALLGVSTAGTIESGLRGGDSIGGKTVKSFTTFSTAATSRAQGRSMSARGEVVALVTFTDKTSALVKVTFP